MLVCAHVHEFWSLFSVCYLRITFLYDVLIFLPHGPRTPPALGTSGEQTSLPLLTDPCLSSQEDIASFNPLFPPHSWVCVRDVNHYIPLGFVWVE